MGVALRKTGAGVYKISAGFAGDSYYHPAASPYVVWEPIAGLSAKGSGEIYKAGVVRSRVRL